MSHRVSGELSYSEVKGLHCVDQEWWIDTGLQCAFAIRGPGAFSRVVDLLAMMTDSGRLVVSSGYLWDGSSGPTVDGKADPVPSLVHDVLYEAMRARKLPLSMRPEADRLYYNLLRERGMGRVRAGLRWAGLRLFARWAASPKRGPEYPRRSAE